MGSSSSVSTSSAAPSATAPAIATTRPVVKEIPAPAPAQPSSVGHRNGECWLDSDGNPIQSHGGGMLVHEGWYYWYGEHRGGELRDIGGRKRRAAVGISCYCSPDLLAWENLGVVLPAVDDPTHDLYVGSVIERPKVVFNTDTEKFIMWLHVDSPDYKAARAGVAVADSPRGPFQYLESFRPNGFESRDQTVFRDDDNIAYHFAASDDNQNTMISRLSDDYLRPSGKHSKRLLGRSMEAFAVCKRGGQYWMVASGCTGWTPNEARSCVADDILGEWQERGNPCVGTEADTTFKGQSAFIIPDTVARRDPILMLDLWRPKDLATSGYIWLPIVWTGARMIVSYQDIFQKQ